MDHHPRILQQRVEVAAIGRRWQAARERIRGEQQEGKETDPDPSVRLEVPDLPDPSGDCMAERCQMTGNRPEVEPLEIGVVVVLGDTQQEVREGEVRGQCPHQGIGAETEETHAPEQDERRAGA